MIETRVDDEARAPEGSGMCSVLVRTDRSRDWSEPQPIDYRSAAGCSSLGHSDPSVTSAAGVWMPLLDEYVPFVVHLVATILRCTHPRGSVSHNALWTSLNATISGELLRHRRAARRPARSLAGSFAARAQQADPMRQV